MFELRIYTLRTAEALERYADIHWPRHLDSLAKHRITTHGIWTAHDADVHRLFALVSYEEGANAEQVTVDYMSSDEFASDMAGFDMQDFTSVEAVLLDATATSPLR
jgi:hypothetical protein